MRKLRFIEHISLDGVIRHSADGGVFPSGVLLSVYRAAGPLKTV